MGRTFSADEATAGRERVAIAQPRLLAAPARRRTRRDRQDTDDRRPSAHDRRSAAIGDRNGHVQDDRRHDCRSCSIASATRRDDRRLYVTGVLKPGVPREQAEADLFAVARQLQTDYPRTNARIGVVVRPLIELLGANITAVVYCCSRSIAVMVVCIACANVSSIILAHVATRRRELAVRAALGAGRLQQIRQFMIESLVTSSAAGAVGLFLAWWGLVAIRFASAGIEGFREMSLNGRVLAVSVALTLAGAPRVSRCCRPCACRGPTWKSCARAIAAPKRAKGRRLRESLVVAQVALALILMTQVALIGRTTWRLHYMD